MEPTVSVNYLAILVCVVVAMPLGFLWFGPLFGKAWARYIRDHPLALALIPHVPEQSE